MSWYPNATRRDGPPGKGGYGGQLLGQKDGIVFHSMEGSLAAALGELDRPDRQACWTFSNPKIGPLLQHYPVEYHTWASGSPEANIRFVSIETEGRAGEPLTQVQIDNDVGLLRWLRDYCGWPGLERYAQLWEHREMTRFGSAPTACPSGRIPWDFMLGLLEEDDMPTQAEWDALKAQVQAIQDAQNAFARDVVAADASLQAQIDGLVERIKAARFTIEIP